MYLPALMFMRVRRMREPARRFAAGIALVTAVLAIAACRPVQPVAAVAQAETVAAEVEATETAEEQDAPTAAPAAEPPQDAETASNTVDDVAPDEALIEQGYTVYRAQYCGVCHTLASAGTKGTFGPPHDGMAATASERIADPHYSGEAASSADYLYESLVKPEIFIVDGYASSSHRMPPYTHLAEQDLRALVEFLLAQQ